MMTDKLTTDESIPPSLYLSVPVAKSNCTIVLLEMYWIEYDGNFNSYLA